MDFSMENSQIYLHIFVALSSIGLTLTWERLRQHSKMIDCISTQTQYLSTMTYWTLIRLMQRMDTIQKDVESIKETHNPPQESTTPIEIPTELPHNFPILSNEQIYNWDVTTPWTFREDNNNNINNPFYEPFSASEGDGGEEVELEFSDCEEGSSQDWPTKVDTIW